MITSMTQSELYKTLVGHYKPNYYSAPENSKPAEKAEVKQIAGIPIEELNKAMKEKMKENKKDRPYIDLSNDPNMDHFEPSKLKIAESQDIGLYSENLKEMPYKAADAINFMCTDIRVELGRGYINGIATKERIAEFYGNMAKRLDEAYAEGKFTKDEFDELNELIENQVERDAGAYEYKKASYAIGQKRYNLPYEEAMEVIHRQKNMTSEEFMAEQEQMISDYAERYCKIDRVALMKLFNSIRYGK